jgi:lipoprotein NlpI
MATGPVGTDPPPAPRLGDQGALVRGIVVGALIVAAAAASAQDNDAARQCREATDPDLAVRQCTLALQSRELSPANLAAALSHRGNAYQTKGAYDLAIRDYDQTLALNPEDSDVFNNRGNAYLRKGEWDLAIRDYDRTVSLNPDHARAFNNRGNAYQYKGQYDRAIQDYDEAIRLDPNSALPFNNRGRAYHAQGAYRRAIQDYDRAIDLQPDYGLAYYNRGLARFDWGLFVAAIPDFARAAQWEPANPYRLIGLYLAQARGGEADRENLASRSAKLDLAQWPGPVIALFLGKLAPEAVTEAARDPEPGRQRERQCEAYFYLGEYLLVQGQRSKAVGLFRAAVQTGASTLFEYVSAQAELKQLAY